VDERRREPSLLERAQDLFEARDLLARERGIFRVGVGEVRVDRADAQALERVDGGEEVDRLGRVDAGAAHPRVDLDVHAARAPDLERRGGELARELERGQRELEPVGQRLRNLAREQRREHPHVLGEAGGAQLHALVQRRDAELAHAPRSRGTRDLDGAVAVGVGLDDQEDLAPRTDRPAQRVEVGIEDVEVDFDPG
jgi:hypothetical protein